ncbi:MAG: alpha/beta hydrolase, partial [Tannerella sp.]|nr:alpha/beta hydrolase [Tannerella sp.]
AVATRGHGKSEVGTEPVTYEQRVNDAYSVIQAVTKDSVIVLGFSDGAYTGYKLASMYPATVKKLIAIGAGEQYPSLRKVVVDTDKMKTENPEGWRRRLASAAEPDKVEINFKRMEHFYNTMKADKALFNSIKCPVLVMSGEHDLNALLPTVISTYNMIPNSQLSIIPNAPHPVFMVNFPAVWASIVPFLEKQSE